VHSGGVAASKVPGARSATHVAKKAVAAKPASPVNVVVPPALFEQEAAPQPPSAEVDGVSPAGDDSQGGEAQLESSSVLDTSTLNIAENRNASVLQAVAELGAMSLDHKTATMPMTPPALLQADPAPIAVMDKGREGIASRLAAAWDAAVQGLGPVGLDRGLGLEDGQIPLLSASLPMAESKLGQNASEKELASDTRSVYDTGAHTMTVEALRAENQRLRDEVKRQREEIIRLSATKARVASPTKGPKSPRRSTTSRLSKPSAKTEKDLAKGASPPTSPRKEAPASSPVAAKPAAGAAEASAEEASAVEVVCAGARGAHAAEAARDHGKLPATGEAPDSMTAEKAEPVVYVQPPTSPALSPTNVVRLNSMPIMVQPQSTVRAVTRLVSAGATLTPREPTMARSVARIGSGTSSAPAPAAPMPAAAIGLWVPGAAGGYPAFAAARPGAGPAGGAPVGPTTPRSAEPTRALSPAVAARVLRATSPILVPRIVSAPGAQAGSATAIGVGGAGTSVIPVTTVLTPRALSPRALSPRGIGTRVMPSGAVALVASLPAMPSVAPPPPFAKVMVAAGPAGGAAAPVPVKGSETFAITTTSGARPAGTTAGCEASDDGPSSTGNGA